MIIARAEMNKVNQKLAASEFKFYLTGSVFFRGKGKDIDYFVQDSQKVREFLINSGFQLLPPVEHNYMDFQCSAVFRNTLGNPSVDVQCVTNAKLKSKIQNTFLKAGVFSPTTVMWNLAFQLYDEIKKVD